MTVAKPGDPVLLSYDYCGGGCAVCKAGNQTYCLEFNPRNFLGNQCFSTSGDKPDIYGSFFGQSSFASMSVVSEKSVVNAKDLIKNDDELKLYSPLGCGIQTGAGAIANVAKPGPDDSVAVIGLGGVGLSALMAAKVRGVKTIIAVDRVPERIALAKELGATHGIDTSAYEDNAILISSVQQCTPDGLGPSVTVETTGVAKLTSTGIDFTRPRGTIIQIGTSIHPVEINIQMFMVTGKKYIGVIEGDSVPSEFLPEIISWYRKGQFPLDKLVKYFKAEDFKKALEEMHHGADAVKPVLLW